MAWLGFGEPTRCARRRRIHHRVSDVPMGFANPARRSDAPGGDCRAVSRVRGRLRIGRAQRNAATSWTAFLADQTGKRRCHAREGGAFVEACVTAEPGDRTRITL